MGAYVYRLRGKKHFTEMPVEGKLEKVYDLVYWYKPYYSFWDTKEPRWMKGVRLFEGRLTSMFKDIDVKYVRSIFIDQKTGKRTESDYILKWKKGKVCVVDEPDWEGLQHIKVHS